MSSRLLLPVALAAAIALSPSSLYGQAPNPECTASGNPLTCAGPAEQQYLASHIPSQPEPGRLPNALAASSLGAILAQRLADKPAVWKTFAQARGDNARIGAQNARANYNAMTAAMQRMLVDIATWSGPRLNDELNLDFSLLKDIEARYEEATPGTGRRREALTRMSYGADPDGAQMFRLEENGELFVEQQKVWTYRAAIRYEPATSIFYQTEEKTPLLSEVPPGYEAAALVGDNAFVAQAPKRKMDAKVEAGAVFPTMLGLIITAMPGELPASFRIWIVNDQGEVVPADIAVIGELTVQEPVGPASGCADAAGINQPRRAVQLQVSAGPFSHTRTVLADAPHLKVSDDLKCRVVR